MKDHREKWKPEDGDSAWDPYEVWRRHVLEPRLRNDAERAHAARWRADSGGDTPDPQAERRETDSSFRNESRKAP